MRHYFLKRFLPLLLILIVPFFFIGGPDWVSPPWVSALWDFGHVIFFAGLIIALQPVINMQNPIRWLWVSLAALLVGGVIEVIQDFCGRDASLRDLLRNLLGVWIGLFWGMRATARIWLLRIVSVLLITPTLWSMGHVFWVQVYVARQFPVLNAFENATDVARVHGKVFLSTEHFAKGSASLKIVLEDEAYSGAGIHYLLGDWRGYQSLSMELFNPDTLPLSLMLRVTDQQHDRGNNDYDDRFNLPIVLQSGWNSIRIPLGDIERSPRTRLLDLGAVSRVNVFANGFAPGRVFYWDYLRLE